MSETIRKAIQESDQTVCAISRATGIDRAGLGRFMAGKSLRLDIADKLAAYFKLELKAVTRRRK